MRNDFWILEHPMILVVIATMILLVAWPLEYVPAIVAAAVLMVAAAAIAARAHFLAPQG